MLRPMHDAEISDTVHARLAALVGRRVDYLGVPCRVIEYLPSEHILVLEQAGGGQVIQPNQFGDANRRVPGIFNLPLFEPDSGRLDPLVVGWLEAVGG